MGIRGWPLSQEAGDTVLDEADSLIVEALRANPLAGFRELGQSAGLNPRSVQRRLGSLLDKGLVQVIASTHPLLDDNGAWMLRVSTTTNKIDSLAETIASNPSTRWVRSTRDGQELLFGLVTPHHSATWMVDDLTHDDRVGSVRVSELLTLWSPSTNGTLRTPPRQLDDLDRKLIELLRADGRADTAEMAEKLGVDPSTVLRRRVRLLSERVITMLVEIDPHSQGKTVEASIFVTMVPGGIRELGARLMTLPMCQFAAATSGSASLVVDVSARDNAELLDFVDSELSDPRITGVEIVPTARMYKRSAMVHSPVVREDRPVRASARAQL